MRAAGERRWGGLTERRLVATAAAAYVVSPDALGLAAPRLQNLDRLSAGYLIALAGRIVREVGALMVRAGEAGKRLPTLALDTENSLPLGPPSAPAFTEDLAGAVSALVARYHDTAAPGTAGTGWSWPPTLSRAPVLRPGPRSAVPRPASMASRRSPRSTSTAGPGRRTRAPDSGFRREEAPPVSDVADLTYPRAAGIARRSRRRPRAAGRLPLP